MKTQAKVIGTKVVESGRVLLAGTANVLELAKAPAGVLVETGLEFGKLAYEGGQRVVRKQLDSFNTTVDLGVKQIRGISTAKSFGELSQNEMELVAEAREAALNGAREYVDLYFDLKGEYDKFAEAKIKKLVAPAKKKGAKKAETAKAA